MPSAGNSQFTGESLSLYSTETSVETLPRYTLTDLNRPLKAHIRTIHTADAASPLAEDYVQAQPQLFFNAEAEIAGNNPQNVSCCTVSYGHLLVRVLLLTFRPNTCDGALSLSSVLVVESRPAYFSYYMLLLLRLGSRLWRRRSRLYETGPLPTSFRSGHYLTSASWLSNY